MAATIEYLEGLMSELGWKYRREDPESLRLGFTTQQYRSPDGAAAIQLVVDLTEEGRYLRVFAPMAFVVSGEHRAAALEACLRFQWNFKMVRFEFDARDGEVRPSVHLPLMDASLGREQLRRVVGAVVDLCERAYPVIGAALERGEVTSAEDPPDLARLHGAMSRLAGLSSEQFDRLLAALTVPEGVSS